MNDLENSPPRRPRALLEEWVHDFKERGYGITQSIKVAQQEDDEENDTGLVVMQLQHVDATFYFEPVGYDEPLWKAVLTTASEETALNPHQVAALAAETVIAGNLCAYLQWRSLEWDRRSGTHEARA